MKSYNGWVSKHERDTQGTFLVGDVNKKKEVSWARVAWPVTGKSGFRSRPLAMSHFCLPGLKWYLAWVGPSKYLLNWITPAAITEASLLSRVEEAVDIKLRGPQKILKGTQGPAVWREFKKGENKVLKAHATGYKTPWRLGPESEEGRSCGADSARRMPKMPWASFRSIIQGF